MPAETTTVVNVSCDNPACPGNDLQPDAYDGWYFFELTQHLEVEGAPFPVPVREGYVFCCPGCIAALEGLVVSAQPV